jgi:hypothetical protein
MQVSLIATGIEKAEADTRAVGARLLDLQPAYEAIFGAVERGEERRFDELGGKYVDSGDLKASLTQSDALGAIREAHAEYADFGSSIPYAIYQREGGKSAVGGFDNREKAEAGAIMLHWVMNGVRP